MTQIPDFSQVEFSEAPTPASAAAAPWLTPEGIAVKPSYAPDDLKGLDFLDTYPGIAPYLRGPYPAMDLDLTIYEIRDLMEEMERRVAGQRAVKGTTR